MVGMPSPPIANGSKPLFMAELLPVGSGLVHKTCFKLGRNDVPEPVNRTVEVNFRNRCCRHLLRANGTCDDLDVTAICAH